MTFRKRLYLLFLLIVTLPVFAQQDPTLRILTLIATDTMILPESVISGVDFSIQSPDSTFIIERDYQFEPTHHRIINRNIPMGMVLTCRYRSPLYDLGKTLRHKSPTLIQPEYKIRENPFVYQTNDDREALFQQDGLNMSGNIARGISIGNSQSLVVNSNLNLQLSGKAGDMDIEAVISDENNPIQPEGNTQQLQDFDKVYIRMSKDQHQVTVGDFQMTRPDQSYFLNYNKKSRGVQASSSFPVSKQYTMSVSGEAALSRGRFTRNIINGMEGNQGPYRLTGPNGETYIVVISGTEAVFLDGQKLTRGEQNDYIIDYNSGELTFMAKRIITRYSRIVVEFQFADKNYERSVIRGGIAMQSKRTAFRVQYFTEQDNRNQPLLQNLTEINKQLLMAVGDNLQEAVSPGATVTRVFSNTRILYRKLDSLGFPNIYVQATSASDDSLFYEVQFSYVGEQKGDYRQLASSANGRVFEWVAPVAGIHQGNYAPVILLVTPKRTAMLTLSTQFAIGKATEISFEYAHTEFNKNTFSSYDQNDNGGNGLHIGITNAFPLIGKWTMRSEVALEQVDKQFHYIERYRNVEFDRIWNRQLNNQSVSDTGHEERIIQARFMVDNPEAGSTYYQLNSYTRDQVYQGLQHQAGIDLHKGKNHLAASGELLNVNSQFSSDNAMHAIRSDIGHEIGNITAGLTYHRERSAFRLGTDTLQYGSYGFDEYAVYVKRQDSSQLGFNASYAQREDVLPRVNEFARSTTGKTVSAGADFRQQNSNRMSVSGAYRELTISDTSLHATPEQTLVLRLEYDYSSARRVITGNTYFQFGSGNELRRDYQFIEVLPGQGQFIWKDFNEDGQQTTNEFVPAAAADRPRANFIRIYLPTNRTVAVNTSIITQTLNIIPAVKWSNQTGWKRIVACFSTQTAWRTERKTSGLEVADLINPFITVPDAKLYSNSTSFRNTVFFNRNHPVFGADYALQQTRGKSFLTYGFDDRMRIEHQVSMRWNLSPQSSFVSSAGSGQRTYQSQFYTENSYVYTYSEIKPRYMYQLTRQVRMTLLASWFAGETTTRITGESREAGGELRITTPRSGTLNIKFSTYAVSFSGSASSPLGYDMLQGLNTGTNHVWNVYYQQMIGHNVQLTFTYDGRKSDEALLHTGKMEARYLF